jgi:hypothetical protein
MCRLVFAEKREPRDPMNSETALETAAPHFLSDQLLQSADVLLLLVLHVGPEVDELLSKVGVGDVLVIPPQGVEAFAQFMDEVMVMIRTPCGFPDMFQFPFCGEAHGNSPCFRGLSCAASAKAR